MISGAEYSLVWAVALGLVLFGVGPSRKIDSLNWGIPILGFARFVLLAQIISVSTKVTLFHATIASASILTLFGLWSLKNFSKDATIWLLRCFITLGATASIITLILAKSNSPFGTYNFDFVYGIQDGLYLAKNSVLIPEPHGGSFPFDWGSVGIGRYCGVFLVTLLNSITNSALVAGEIVYILSISLVFFGLLYFSINVLKLGFKVSFAVALLISVSPLNLMGIHNQLLGQTSGLPLAILILGLLLNRKNWNLLSEPVHQINLATLVVGLFWIYPAQLLLLAPFLSLIYLCILFENHKIGNLKNSIKGVSLVLLTLIVSMSRDFTGTINRIRTLVFYSSESSSSEKGSILYNSIFNQFSSWRGPTISSGLRVYGDTNIFWPIILLYLALVFVLISILAVRHLQKNLRLKSLDQFGLLILFLTYVLSIYLVLYITQSNYLLFKLATWFTPLCTLIVLTILLDKYQQISQLKKQKFVMIFLVLPGIMLTVWNSYTLATRAYKGNDIPFTNSKVAFDEEFLDRISTKTDGAFVYMPAMEEAAWMTINIPNSSVREQINFFGYDQQSLYLGFNRTLPKFPVVESSDSVFIQKTPTDIFPKYELNKAPLWENSNIVETKVSEIEKLFVFGVGAFYPDRASVSPFNDNHPFRWSNGYLSFGVFSQGDDQINLTLPIMTGVDFVEPLEPIVNNGEVSFISKSEEFYELRWEKIAIRKGWNTLILRINNDPIKAVPKNSLRPDFRPLTIAIGKINLN